MKLIRLRERSLQSSDSRFGVASSVIVGNPFILEIQVLLDPPPTLGNFALVSLLSSLNMYHIYIYGLVICSNADIMGWRLNRLRRRDKIYGVFQCRGKWGLCTEIDSMDIYLGVGKDPSRFEGQKVSGGRFENFGFSILKILKFEKLLFFEFSLISLRNDHKKTKI